MCLCVSICLVSDGLCVNVSSVFRIVKETSTCLMVPDCGLFKGKCYVHALVFSERQMLIGSEITTQDRMVTDTGSDRGCSEYIQ